VEFAPETGKMHCKYCGNSYTPEEIAEKENRGTLSSSAAAQREKQTPEAIEQEKQEVRNHATIKLQILRCRSCGGELAFTGTEASSFCPYCGQATVALDRVEECLKPDYIIPFKRTKEEAEKIIKEKLSSGFFIPKEIKNFKTETLRGIYIPYWLYDIYFGDEQCWKYDNGNGRYKEIRYAYRLAESTYKNLPVDASMRLNNDTSERLNPYNTEEIKDFDPVYLSGFYADRFDVGYDTTDSTARTLAKEMFNENVKTTVPAASRSLENSDSYSDIKARKYAFLPAWFLTFCDGGVPYTILVNGQTGKMVGAVPYERKRTYLTFGLLALLFCGIAVPILSLGLGWLFSSGSSFSSRSSLAILAILILIGAVGVNFIRLGFKKHMSFNESVRLTQSSVTNQYVKERQEK